MLGVDNWLTSISASSKDKGNGGKELWINLGKPYARCAFARFLCVLIVRIREPTSVTMFRSGKQLAG